MPASDREVRDLLLRAGGYEVGDPEHGLTYISQPVSARAASAPAEVRRGGVVLPRLDSELALDAAAQGWFHGANQQLVIKVPDQPATIVITVQP